MTILPEYLGMLFYSLLGAGILAVVALHVAGLMVGSERDEEAHATCQGSADTTDRTRVVENIKGFIALKRG